MRFILYAVLTIFEISTLSLGIKNLSIKSSSRSKIKFFSVAKYEGIVDYSSENRNMNFDKLETLSVRNNIAVLLTCIEPRIIAKLSGPNQG